MHRPQSTAESTPHLQLWLRAHGWQALVLAVSYFVFGHASFLVRVDDVLVTPVLFAPEGIALAMALRYGAAVWPGVFVGQLALALSRGLDPLPAASISAINSIEAVLAVLLFRACKLDATLPRARDMAGLLFIIFLILQPFSSTLGNATLWASGIVDRADLSASWLNWWIGNSLGQMLITPLLLALFAGQRTKGRMFGDFLVPLAVILPASWVADHLLRWTGAPSLVVLFAPILVLFAIYRGLAAVCVGGLLIAIGALYATSHALGPFVSDGRAAISELNLFIIGLALSGQFLAVFLRQLRSQQKLADEERDIREQLQRTAYELTENIPVGTYVLEFDAAGSPHFTFLSERFLTMTGLKREEVMANHALALQPMRSTDRSEIERLNREVFASKKRFFWEGEITVRGEKRQVTLESIPRTRPGGGTIWEGVMTDITERKLAEQKLAAANRNMQLAASAARLGFWEYDVETGLDQWDEEMSRINGISLETFDGRWEKFVHPDDYDEVMRQTRQMIDSDRIFEMEYRIVRPDGEVRHIREHGNVTRDANGRAVRINGVVLDVTEERAAADKLRQATESMKLAAAAAGIGFWSRAIATSTEQWDEQMFRIYDVERDSFDGRWERHVHPQDLDRVLRETQSATEEGRNGVYEFRVVRPDGTIRHVQGLSTIVRDPDGQPLREIGVDFDVTEEREAAARERQAEEKHRRDLETKLKTSLAAAVVAHEINQPLSAILLRTKMALGGKQNDSETLSAVADEAQRVVTTIEKMKTLMRNVQTEHSEFNLSSVVRSALLYNKNMLARHDVTVRESGLDKAHMIMGDDAQLQLAITNILRNAAEAIDESAADRREVSVDLAESDSEVILSIGDSGPGWSGAELAEMPLTTTKKGGTGIGLYVARTAMENHRGKISFGKSALGGAEVKMMFPRAEAEEFSI